MTADRSTESAGDVDLDLVGYSLGEGDRTERRALRSSIDCDLDAVTELAETSLLLDSMRSLGQDIEPTGRVAQRMRGAARQRLEMLGLRRASRTDRVAVALRVAAVALVWFGISWATFGAGLEALRFSSRGEPTVVGSMRSPQVVAPASSSTRGVDFERRRLLHDEHFPVTSESFLAAFERLFPAVERTPEQRHSGFAARLAAENLLAHLRREAVLRSSAEARAAARRVTGVPNIEARVERVAAEVAARLSAALDEDGDASADRDSIGIAYALRSLLASGSSAHAGPYADLVDRARAQLVARVESGDDAHLDQEAVLLAALAELAVVEGPRVASIVARGSDRLARSILRSHEDGARPVLLRWSTSAARIAEASRLLELAPAYGSDAELARRARWMLAAHLQERIDIEPDLERPALLAAQLYGCGDLVDRGAVDRRLRLWRVRHLWPDQVAVQQLAWSRYPVRAGWSGFQDDLRGLSGRPCPVELLDSAAFLLTLCTNVAAPRVLESLPGVADSLPVAGV